MRIHLVGISGARSQQVQAGSTPLSSHYTDSLYGDVRCRCGPYNPAPQPPAQRARLNTKNVW